MGSSDRSKQVHTLIVDDEAVLHAQQDELHADRRELDAVADAAVTSAFGFVHKPAAARSLWPPRIVGERAGSIYFLDTNEVEYVESAGNYVVAHLGANGYLTRATLKTLAAQLKPLGFVQIERSLLINLRQVDHVERRERGQYCFVMRGGAHLVSSRERHGSIHALLQSAMTPGRM